MLPLKTHIYAPAGMSNPNPSVVSAFPLSGTTLYVHTIILDPKPLAVSKYPRLGTNAHARAKYVPISR
jgi:hypothetical protein